MKSKGNMMNTDSSFRQFLRDFRHPCPSCGVSYTIDPETLYVYDDAQGVAFYLQLCTCGATLMGAFGPPEYVNAMMRDIQDSPLGPHIERERFVEYSGFRPRANA